MLRLRASDLPARDIAPSRAGAAKRSSCRKASASAALPRRYDLDLVGRRQLSRGAGARRNEAPVHRGRDLSLRKAEVSAELAERRSLSGERLTIEQHLQEIPPGRWRRFRYSSEQARPGPAQEESRSGRGR